MNLGRTDFNDLVFRHEKIRTSPVPAWKVHVPKETEGDYSFFPIQTLFTLGGGKLLGCAFRGVAISRFDVVMATGVDVQPSDQVMYVGDAFAKAWEYGGWPKLMLAFDWAKLDQTYREVPSNLDPDELTSLRMTFPTMLTSKDGKTLWLSRLNQDNPHLTSSYETGYARWIPGDPFEALQAVLVFDYESE